MKRAFIPLLIAALGFTYGCSLEEVKECKPDTWTCLDNYVTECVDGFYKKHELCDNDTPVCDMATQSCMAKRVPCKDSCRSGLLTLCDENDDVVTVEKCGDSNEVCGYDSSTEKYSCVGVDDASCDLDREIYYVDKKACGCNERYHWVGKVGACHCDEANGYVELKNGDKVECVKKALCTVSERYVEDKNTCECDSSKGYSGEPGACVCSQDICCNVVGSCVNGCSEAGVCTCSADCENGCDDNGKCIEIEKICSSTCVNGCDENYECKCEEGCENGCDKNGACNPSECPTTCVNGCDDSNQCKCEDGCENGCDLTGVCNPPGCPSTCINGCDDSNQCKCSNVCVNGCNADGSCACSASCTNGCEDDGTCLPLTCPDTCKDRCDIEHGTCLTADINHNNLLDFYENAPKQGQSCKKYSDCDSAPDMADGFCDSAIGYKCSTLCTDDKQCVNDDYFCREDGRCAPKVFETVWDIPENGLIFYLPAGKDTCDYKVDWGDGNIEEFKSCGSAHRHEYAAAGEYSIKITGTFIGWTSPNRGEYLKDIKSFGPVVFNRGSGFANCKNLEGFSATDIPNANSLNMYGFFMADTKFNQDISNWDVSKCTDFSRIFELNENFNQSLDKWDTSNAQKMEQIFYRAYKFNSSINGWDVSKVISMEDMFQEATAYNKPLDSWDVSQVQNMLGMFNQATNFNQSLNSWNTANLTNSQSMFVEAVNYNQPMNNWNTSKITRMGYMFSGAKKFNQNLSSWDLSSVTDMGNIFYKSGMSTSTTFCSMRSSNAGWASQTPDKLGVEITCN